jgi:hypothetical protein
MRSLPLLLAFLLAVPLARADGVGGEGTAAPVVVELYTSQGCIACPPADALFTDLAGMDGVIALALHVDYWDYLGWKDGFARAEHTARQKAYAAEARSRTLYTPQLVVQGEDRLKGLDAAGVLADIARRRAEPAEATVSAERTGEGLTLRMAPVAGGVGPADVQVVAFMPSQTVSIDRGDNAGRELTYANIVTDWRTVARWDGTGPFEMTLDRVDPGPLAVVVQRPGPGPVLAATALP